MRAWQHLAREVLKADPQNEKANTLLGHTKVGGRWYKSKSEADAARKTEIEAEMKAKGFIKVADGWISKEDKPSTTRTRSAFEIDENGVLRDKATVMREKGYTLVKGKWVKGASAARPGRHRGVQEGHRRGHPDLAVRALPPRDDEHAGREDRGVRQDLRGHLRLVPEGDSACRPTSDSSAAARRRSGLSRTRRSRTRGSRAGAPSSDFDEATSTASCKGRQLLLRPPRCILLENNEDIRNSPASTASAISRSAPSRTACRELRRGFRGLGQLLRAREARRRAHRVLDEVELRRPGRRRRQGQVQHEGREGPLPRHPPRGHRASR